MKNDLYPDLMLDIETFGLDPDTIVVSIGAVRFRFDAEDDLDTIREEERGFYAVLDTEEQEADGRSITQSTMDWWDEQSIEARSVLRADMEDVRSALDRFVAFCAGVRRVWGNGNVFDNIIVRNLCEQYDRNYPVKFPFDLDMRTVKYVWNYMTKWASKDKPKVRLGTHHNALDDARSQVIQFQQMIKELRGTRYGDEPAE